MSPHARGAAPDGLRGHLGLREEPVGDPFGDEGQRSKHSS